MGIFTTIMILNFSFFYFWAGNKIIESVIANSQLNAAYDEIKEANAEILQQNEEISTQRDMIEAKITGMDRKTHLVTLSIKGKDAQPKKPRATAASKKKEKSTDTPLKTTLGDLLKAKMSQDGGEK